MTLISMLGIERRLKREDHKYLVTVACYLMYAPLFPCPDFRWNIVDDFGLRQMLLAVFSNLEIERWVVYQNEHIRLLL